MSVYSKKPYMIRIQMDQKSKMNIFKVVYGFLLNNYIVNIKWMVYNVKNGAKLEQWILLQQKL